MSKTDEITKLERNIKDAETRKVTLLTNVDALSKEINILCGQEMELEDNLQCLKKTRIVAVAKEYQKIREELIKVKGKIVNLANSKDQYRNAISDMDKFIASSMKELDKLQKITGANVLQFRRKDG